jgi:hypothetical protein
MSLARRIIRGTFRLSIVAAFLAAGWGLVEGVNRYDKEWNEIFQRHMRSERGYACAARQDDGDLLALQTVFQTIDVSKLGCATEPFYVKMTEINKVRSQGLEAFLGPRQEPYSPQWDFGTAGIYALGWFLLVNILGLAVVVTIYVSRWVASGFNTKS